MRNDVVSNASTHQQAVLKVPSAPRMRAQPMLAVAKPAIGIATLLTSATTVISGALHPFDAKPLKRTMHWRTSRHSNTRAAKALSVVTVLSLKI
jgi:hypothetical protein